MKYGIKIQERSERKYFMDSNPEQRFEKIYKTSKYAKDHGIVITDPSTWDDNFKRRAQKLAGIIPNAISDLQSIEENIEKI